MGQERAIVALGGNLGDPRASFAAALALMEQKLGPILARSNFRETAPLVLPRDDPAEHPTYLNGVVIVAVEAEALTILSTLHDIERSLGRDRATEAGRWQPRLIDLDLIALGDVVIDSAELVLPHPRMAERAFVLAPLVEVWPDWRHPRLGKTVLELLAELEARTK